MSKRIADMKPYKFKPGEDTVLFPGNDNYRPKKSCYNCRYMFADQIKNNTYSGHKMCLKHPTLCKYVTIDSGFVCKEWTRIPVMPPCPFCGSHADIAQNGYGIYWGMCGGSPTCITTRGAETIDEAARIWSRRAVFADNPVEQENVRLRKTLKDLMVHSAISCEGCAMKGNPDCADKCEQSKARVRAEIVLQEVRHV